MNDDTADGTVTVEMTPAELTITHNALHAFLTDFGHDEDEVIAGIRSALARIDRARTSAVGSGVAARPHSR